ncbi:cyclic AMP response element-binding protein A isoform X1 [Bactrocera neohumeralis]|uniref:cyclic AMP response element-binding protein A isoform X1 n=1 Tax=Bactrocera neohumeralis TaxID=98809 RepID=UPI0021668645|nr:cyclic AMP response element-binding protein A isoform X1 [Bactrocera neohumeralis]XP_050334813.1 cyclic AMP response element-binding protein A isoform X1 [Bactrocera neohumeralis]
MEGFYDGDLKDIWDSDLDPTESLKISTDSDLHDWFMERDMKDPAVMILNDKLMSDALFNLQPIKSEHSYSLNSDGDSLPDSPHSLQTKMDDMEDECYPAISLKTATSNTARSRHDVDITNSVDPKCLAISVDCDDTPMELATLEHSTHTTSSSSKLATNTLLTTAATSSTPTLNSTLSISASTATGSGTLTASTTTRQSATALPLRYTHAGIYASLSKINTTAPMTFNLRTAETSSGTSSSSSSSGYGGSNTTTITLSKPAATQQQQLQQQSHLQQYLPQAATVSTVFETSSCRTPSTAREGSSSPDICSDIEIDESAIKDEPMSPDSSCPPSPNSPECITMAKISKLTPRTNSDLVFEHKNGCLQLTPASQSLLKAQQLATTVNNGQNIVMPKLNIKSESSYNGVGANVKHNGQYGLPLTPPSCSSSDGDSEGNLTPEHLLSPLSPNTSVSISVANPAVITPVALHAANVRRSASSSSSSSPSSASSSTSSLHAAGRHASGGTSGSTRQPIHTPLISSQPKGSTGVLILTEEEKRTLQAEGYPIPQKLPLTKAEEKSLKKIRRKIKNKISAQESRRKKKEYMDQLERRVEILVNENNEQRKRCDALEHTNANLLSQLHKLQAMLNKQNSKKNA